MLDTAVGGLGLSPVSRTLRATAKLVRLRSSICAPVLTVAGWWVMLGWHALAHWPQVLSSAVSGFAFIAFAQVYNDIKDLSLDAASKPWRPLPSGQISVAFAWTTAIVLALMSLGCALPSGTAMECVCAFCLLLDVAYSPWLKSTVLIGNLVVALVSSAPFALPAAVYQENSINLFLGQALIFLFIVGNELYKSAEDADADAEHGYQTIATVSRAHTVVIAMAACWLGMAVILALCAWDGVPAFGAVGALLILAPTGGAVLMSRGAARDGDSIVRAGHRLWRLAWAFGLPVLTLLR